MIGALGDAIRSDGAPSRTLVVGLGTTGLSCARFLHAQGVSVAVTDSRSEPPGLARMREELPDVALFLGRFDERAFANAGRLVVSPGVSLRHPLITAARARGVPISGDIDLFADQVRAPVVGITGSNGKSTVTSLLGVMAEHSGIKARVGGNLGTPALDLLSAGDAELYILELSSFQLELVQRLRPCAAVVLNVSADHMDRYASMDEYAAAKRRIYDRADVLVINADDPRVAMMTRADRKSLRFTLGEPGEGEFGMRELAQEVFLCQGSQPLLPVSDLRMVGRHNLADALAALALAEAVGLPRDACLRAARNFPGLAHRMQWVAESSGVSWVNDSKATNVGACLAALEGTHQKVVLIAGGDGKGADFSPLRPVVAARARAVVLIGRDAPRLEKALTGAVPITHASDLPAAVARAGELAQPGDMVLLSPACASFDMFSGFEERGRVFVDTVKRWLA